MVTLQDVRSHFSFCSSKNICQFSSRSQVLSRGSLAPTLPLIPQPLHPPLLSNPAALPLLCILHLLDYSAVSKHSARVAPSIVRSVTGLYFLLNFWVDASCRVHNLASLNISVPEFVFKRQFNSIQQQPSCLFTFHLKSPGVAWQEFIPSGRWFSTCQRCTSLCVWLLQRHSVLCKSLLTLERRQTSWGDAAGLSKSHKVDIVRFCYCQSLKLIVWTAYC